MEELFGLSPEELFYQVEALLYRVLFQAFYCFQNGKSRCSSGCASYPKLRIVTPWNLYNSRSMPEDSKMGKINSSIPAFRFCLYLKEAWNRRYINNRWYLLKILTNLSNYGEHSYEEAILFTLAFTRRSQAGDATVLHRGPWRADWTQCLFSCVDLLLLNSGIH